MKRPADPLREKPRAVTEPYRCPFCGAKLKRHCQESHTCDLLKCTSPRCSAYGPETGMVLR